MNIFTGLVALIVTLVVVAYVVQPFFSRRVEKEERRTDRHMTAILHQRADLLAERDRIYRTINELDFDHATNKVSDEDYARQRRRLVARGVEVLQRLDALPDVGEEDSIEGPVPRRFEGDAGRGAGENAS